MSHITRTIVLSLALATAGAPAAVAQQQDLRNPDNRGGGAYQDYRGADAKGAPTDAGTNVVVVKAPPTTTEPASGIDWADAGIGAGGLLGVTLIGLGGTLIVVQRRHRVPAQH